MVMSAGPCTYNTQSKYTARTNVYALLPFAGVSQTQALTSAADVSDALRTHFGIELPEGATVNP